METEKYEVQQDLKTLVSEIRLVYHPKLRSSERAVIKKSEDAYRIIMESWNRDTIHLFEELKLVLLNSGNGVLGIITLSTGGMQNCICDPRLVFLTAIKAGATAILLTHNHPSGNCFPSSTDKALTEKIKSGCQLLSICLTDHLIVNIDGYYSFADEGLL